MTFNADGSYSELSGNGVRCLAAWLAHMAHLSPGATVSIETDAGQKQLALLQADGTRYQFRAAMGRPEQLRQERLTVAEEVVTIRATLSRTSSATSAGSRSTRPSANRSSITTF